MAPLGIWAQSYSTLWKQVDEAGRKDLPKTQIELLEKIVSRAEKEKSYGNLLAAELMTTRLWTEISSDSLDVQKSKLERRAANAEEKDKVLAAVYYCALGKMQRDDDSNPNSQTLYFDKAMAHPELLARHQAAEYVPLITKGKDDAIFHNDLLHVIGLESGRYEVLNKYYNSVGNREAACYTALKAAENNVDAVKLDSIIRLYDDLPICGEVAVRKFMLLKNDKNISAKEKLDFIDKALGRWGTWEGMNRLRNERTELICPMFSATLDSEMGIPNKKKTIEGLKVRNINDLTLTITRTTLDGNAELNSYNPKDIQRIKSACIASTAQKITHRYDNRQPYEIVEDSLELPKLSTGVYLLEFSSSATGMKTQYNLYYVTNVFLMSEEQPNKRIRYVVVNATTGQPIANASLKLTFDSRYGGRSTTKMLTTDKKGEAFYTYNKVTPDEVFAFTQNDQACPNSNLWTSFQYRKDENTQNICDVFTDRSVYRPGQTVHTSVIVYTKDEKQLETKAKADCKLTLQLRDANYKEIATKDVTTDEYGTATADFELPKSGLTGRFSIIARYGNNGSTTFNVEEYKRPTFEVEFDKYEKKYAIGDTIKVKGRAKTYSGIPVQGAKVEYAVNRRSALWWWRTGDANEQLAKGEITTDEKGEFEINVPFIFPKNESISKYPYQSYPPNFYNFVAEAKVTDVAGETREGSLSLPLGSKATAFTCDLLDKNLSDSLKSIKFTYLNAAGKSIEGRVKYAILPYGKQAQPAEKDYMEAVANEVSKLKSLKSGRYKLYAVCGTDTLEKEFVVFSLDDKRPVAPTHYWFYQSAKQFPRDGKPVYIQVGSSDKDQHIVYSIYSGNKIIETGAIDQSNAITTRKLVYKEEYGNGLTLTFAWVKNGEFYNCTANIERPQPDKQLRVAWKTFRDRLLPGQEEEWTLTILNSSGKPATAQLMATLYDKSLDQIIPHVWSFNSSFYSNLPYAEWTGIVTSPQSIGFLKPIKWLNINNLKFATFDERFLSRYYYMDYNRRFTRNNEFGTVLMAVGDVGARKMEAKEQSSPTGARFSAPVIKMDRAIKEESVSENRAESGIGNVQLRENLNETAFFYPRMETDKDGNVNLKFRLPESLTTWRFIGLAHDKDINTGMITGDVVAQKTVMIQPNMPRFVRMGDEATLSARLFSTSEKQVTGTATIEIVDPATEKVLYSESKAYSLSPKGTSSATFSISDLLSETGERKLSTDQSLLIVRVFAKGTDYSDGEQQYLSVLPSREYVINTYPFTQNEKGTKTIDLTKLFPKNTTNQRLTIEYTNNPNWLMLQALPYVADANEKNAISLVSAYYANTLANMILKASPKIKQTIDKWRSETGKETSMMSALEKNQELKELVLNETPWVLDAQDESERKQMLVRYFNENQLRNNLNTSLSGLRKLQNPDGSFSWWQGMSGSMYMTVEVVKTLSRLNVLLGATDSQTKDLLNKAFRYLDEKVAQRVAEMKKVERKGQKNLFPSDALCDYLYSNALAKRQTTADIAYLINLLSKKPVELTIYGKANTAVILQQYRQTAKAAEYLKSIGEYTVYTEEKGRYFDTSKAYYSWCDYKIPTQVAAIEAFKTITPKDDKTIKEMQRWLLQSKRTQSWDTPVNSVNAVWAFMNGGNMTLDNGEESVLKLDGKIIATPKSTAGMGYVKVSEAINVNDSSNGELRNTVHAFSAEKTSTGTGWGAVYAQFFQSTTAISDATSGLKIKREIIPVGVDNKPKEAKSLKVGDKVLVRLTITADRDYDFVQVIDKRAACLEPVKQNSGYQWGGYYVAPKDYTTNYYFDSMSKGTHIVETEYFIDRSGSYQTGTCSAQCAYSPEYSGRAKGITMEVKE